jgi:hypothetical protein
MNKFRRSFEVGLVEGGLVVDWTSVGETTIFLILKMFWMIDNGIFIYNCG